MGSQFLSCKEARKGKMGPYIMLAYPPAVIIVLGGLYVVISVRLRYLFLFCILCCGQPSGQNTRGKSHHG
jgi:hypothetical protein